VDCDGWAPWAPAEIRAAVDGLGERLTDLAVRIETKHMNPAEALIHAGQSSDLVVIGRHDALTPLGSHLGPVARAVVAEAACPVLLADPRPGHRWHRHGQTAEHRVGTDAT
jgi:nucleotide-binding universal stress UspA family protein